MSTSQQPRAANIGTAGRRKRLVFGILALGTGAAIAVLLVLIQASLVWRLPLFLPFFAGALGVFQARDKT